jgi:tRNA 2-thiouridine synthesizing protein A
MARYPIIDLPAPFDTERMTQRRAQSDAPQADHRMASLTRGGDRKLTSLFNPRLVQTRNEIAWQERTIAGSADYIVYRGPLCRGPVERRKHTCERASMPLHIIGDHWQAQRRKSLGIVVGVDDEAGALWGKARHDAAQNRASGENAQRLVPSAHALRASAGEDDAQRRDSVVHENKFRPRSISVDHLFARLVPLDDARCLPHRSNMATTILDLIGLNCPLPVLKTRKALAALKPGGLLRVYCTDPLAVIDIPNLIRETGDRVEIAEQAERRVVFLIKKRRVASIRTMEDL